MNRPSENWILDPCRGGACPARRTRSSLNNRWATQGSPLHGWWIALLLGFLAPPLSALDMELLRSNGASFIRGEERLPIRSLDIPKLLGMQDSAREAAMDRAAAAGFNA